VSTKQLAIVLTVAGAVLGGCGRRDESPPLPTTGIFSLGARPTSPAGGDLDAPAPLGDALIRRGRPFRGNPAVLGVLIGSVLAVALVMGVFTIRVAYRRPPGDERHGQSREA
jgi:hypothetical protein